MTYRVRALPERLRVGDAEHVARLHERTLPGVRVYDLSAPHSRWWLAWSDDADWPVGFAGARYDARHHAVFMVAAGVLGTHRGQGIHGRLIHARRHWARRIGAQRIVTYTVVDNAASANSLIRAGFRRSALWCYAGSDVEYWEREP